jgi:hypothetical protein
MHVNRTSLPVIAVALLVAAAMADEVGENWTLEVADVDYRTTALLTQDSSDAIADEYATREVNPQLSFRCYPDEGSKLSVSIDWRRFISSFNTEVGFKVDDREMILLNWGVDRSEKVTSPRSGDNVQELLDYFAGGNHLQVEIIPYSEGLVSVSYDISGIDAALVELRSRCE